MKHAYKYVLNPDDPPPPREPVAFTTCHSFSRDPLKVAYHAAEHEYYACTDGRDTWPYTFAIQTVNGKMLGRFVVDILTELDFEVGVEDSAYAVKPEVPGQMMLMGDE